MDVEEALRRLGGWGRWQTMLIFLIGISYGFVSSWHMLAIVFIGGRPEHHCQLHDGEVFNKTIPLEFVNGVWVPSRCQRYVNNTNVTEECDAWSYDPDIGSTIVTEWDLVCDKDYLKDTTQTVMVFGVMLGAMFFSVMSDLLGRKPVFIFSLVSMAVIGTITAFVQNYIVFTALRFIAGALQQGIVLTGFVLACELFPASKRTYIGAAVCSFWSSGMMVLALLAFFIRHWRWLQLVISLPEVLAIAFYWLLPESFRWLVANGRNRDAQKIFYKAAKFNKVHLPDEVFTLQDSDELPTNGKAKFPTENRNLLTRIKKRIQNRKEAGSSDGDQYTFLDILRHGRLLFNTLVMCYIWFVNALVYYGLSLSTATLAGNRYLNFFLAGVVDLISNFTTLWTLQCYGRRRSLCAYHIIAGLALLVTAFVPEKTGSGLDLVPLIITFNMISRFGISSSFITIFLFTPEIFPTTLRNQGMGISSVGGRIGNMLAPFSAYATEKLPWLPGLLFTICSIAAGLLALMLPETLNKILPQTIEDVYRICGKTLQHPDVGSTPLKVLPDKDVQEDHQETKLGHCY